MHVLAGDRAGYDTGSRHNTAHPCRVGGVQQRVLSTDDVLMRSPRAVEVYAFERTMSRRLEKEVIKLVREDLKPYAEGLSLPPSGYLMHETSEVAIRLTAWPTVPGQLP